MTAAPWRPRSKPQADADKPADLEVAIVEGPVQTPPRAMLFAAWLVCGKELDEVCGAMLHFEELAEAQRQEEIRRLEAEIAELEAKRDELAGIRRPRRADVEAEEGSMP